MARNTPANTTVGGGNSEPVLQWANGLSKRRNGKRLDSLTGWHIEKGVHEEIDGVCEAAQTPTITIVHQEGGEKPHWFFGEEVKVLLLTNGAKSYNLRTLTQDSYANAEDGIAVYWRTDKSGIPRSNMSVWALFGGMNGELVDSDGQAPMVRISVNGTMTDRFLQVIADQLEVLKEADNLVDREKHPHAVDYWELWVSLCAGDPYTAGSGSKASTVTPFVANIPDPITRDYLKAVWATKSIAYGNLMFPIACDNAYQRIHAAMTASPAIIDGK
jgi:hypothetical protein